MYAINRDVYDAMMESRNRTVAWHCTITLTTGDVLTLDNSKIVSNVGEIRGQCSGNSDIAIGNAFASELTIQLINVYIDRYLLYDGELDLYARISFFGKLNWQSAVSYTWNNLHTSKWDNINGTVFYDFPMGKFIIKEAMQTAGKIKITAYDFMIKFDVALPTMDKDAKTPYAWLKTACTACGVTLGTSRHDLYYMPNGLRTVAFANSNKEVKTWRDVISQAVAVLGGNAMIGRDGSLVVRQYTNRTVDAITTGGRYRSEFSDYQSYYTGIYLSYREEAIQDYQTNAASAAEDTGLAYDLGYNCFLQIDDTTTRRAMLKEIIDAQAGLVFSPFTVSAPFNPCYDIMDSLEFSGNQADPTRDIAPITSIIWRIGGKMDIACGGENPALQEAQSRESKALENMDSGSLGESLWMVMGNAPASATTISANTATKVGEAMFYAKDDLSMLQIAYTAYYVLNKMALIEAEIFVDSTSVYKTKQNQLTDVNALTVTTGYELGGKESHTVQVYLTVKEATVDIGGGGILQPLSVTSNGEYIAQDEGLDGYNRVTVSVGEGTGYYAGAQAIEYTAPEANVSYVDEFEYSALAETE